MAAWEWHAYDLASGNRLAEVPMATWDHTDRLNDSGDWSGRLAPASTRDLVSVVVGATQRARSLVVGLREGVVAGAGIVWRRNLPDLAGAGLFSYFDRRNLYTNSSTDFTYSAVDQHDLVVDLINRAQNIGTVQVDTSFVTVSGTTRDQTWLSSEAKNIGEAIRQKSAVIDGFDFDVRCELVDGEIVRRLRCWTPQRGRPFTASGLVFTLGHNAWSLDGLDEDGIALTTRSIALGEETDPDLHTRLSTTDTADDVVALGWPLLDEVLDLSDIKTLSVLEDHAEGHLDRWANPDVEEVTLRVDPALWGTWELGDECVVKIPPWSHKLVAADREEWEVPHPWYPDGYEEVRRVRAHRWRVDGTGEALFVTTGPT